MITCSLVALADLPHFFHYCFVLFGCQVDVSGTLDDLNMTVELQQFELPANPVDNTLQFNDLSTEPVIESEPVETSVSVLMHHSLCTASVH